MVLNDLVDSFCYSQKNAGLKGLTASNSLVTVSDTNVAEGVYSFRRYMVCGEQRALSLVSFPASTAVFCVDK